MTPNYGELFRALLPETALTIAALLVLGYDLTLGRKRTSAYRLRAASAIGILGMIAAAFAAYRVGAPGPTFGGIVALDTLGFMTRVGVLLLGALTLGLTATQSRVRHPAE